MITLNAVSIAKPEEIRAGKKVVSTGIFKRPQTSPVKLETLGLEGDNIIDLEVHGGEDQAVYIYLMDDYRWWEQTLKRELTPGIFGENLTFDGMSHQDLKVGDRFKLNNVVLELTGPRIPCSKFSARMGDPSFVKQFFHANRPGSYARVITPGLLDDSCSVLHQPAPEDAPRIDHLFKEWYSKTHDLQFLEQALASPLGQYHRKKIELWLAKKPSVIN